MKRLLIGLLIVVLLGIAAYYIYAHFQAQRNAHQLILYGNVDVRQVDIGFRVSGQVKELKFEEGAYVTAGTLLAELDQTPYNNQLNQAEASALSINKTLENARKQYERRKQVVGIGAVSRENFEDAEANISTLNANYAAAVAAYDVAKNNITYTQAFAPTNGIILTRIREPGSVINAFEPVYILSVSSPVWIRAFVSEVNLGQVHFGMPAEIHIDTPGAPVYHGKIGFISPVAEFTPKTVETTQLRTDLVYRLRIYVDNPDQILKQGMPVTVKLKLNHEK